MMKFKCQVCQIEFEASGIRQEYHDPIYGPCARMIDLCPICGEECRESRTPKPQKTATSADFPCGSAPSGSCSCCPHA